MNSISWAAGIYQKDCLLGWGNGGSSGSLWGLETMKGSDEAAGVWECVGQRSRVSGPQAGACSQMENTKTTARVWEPSSLDWQAFFVLDELDPTLFVCCWSQLEGQKMTGDWGQYHSCFLTRDKKPKFLLTHILSLKRMVPIFGNLLATYQTLVWLLQKE